MSIWLTHLDSKTHCENFFYCLCCRNISQWLTSSENHFTSSVFLQIINRGEERNSRLMTRLLLLGPVDLLLMPLMFCALQGAAHNYPNTFPSFFLFFFCFFMVIYVCFSLGIEDEGIRIFFSFFANKLGIQFKERHQSILYTFVHSIIIIFAAVVNTENSHFIERVKLWQNQD